MLDIDMLAKTWENKIKIEKQTNIHRRVLTSDRT
jgi:hypothetical protein